LVSPMSGTPSVKVSLAETATEPPIVQSLEVVACELYSVCVVSDRVMANSGLRLTFTQPPLSQSACLGGS
jgi:hypothetical protein